MGLVMRMFRPEGGIIRSEIDRWSDCIGQDRDSCHFATLSTILQHFTHTMKPSDPLLLADVTLHCGVYPTGKVDISRHLAIPGSVGKPSADASSPQVILKYQPPICLDYRARNRPQLLASLM